MRGMIKGPEKYSKKNIHCQKMTVEEYNFNYESLKRLESIKNYFITLKRNKMKKLIFAGLAIIATMFVLGFSTGHSSLQSLKADATETPYCTPAQNDCKSSVTGNIYIGYKPSSAWEETGVAGTN